MNEYQRLYRELFDLIMAQGSMAWESPAGEALRKRMDALKGGPQEKVSWGRAVGGPLYQRLIQGAG